MDASREVLCGQSAVDVPETDDSLVVANQEKLGVGRTHLQALDATGVRRLRQTGENYFLFQEFAKIQISKGLQCCCVVPVDDLCGEGEGSKVKNEDVPSLRADVEVAVDLREAALGYRFAPGRKKRYM